MSPAEFTNRLIHETSPYLRQHAHNPVDWYPWGPEAIDRARQLDRPIFLSIGYSACHWCHVMEHESFEDAETAQILNDHFVAIKVDREERPDLDQIYMTAVQLLTGQGGWPMSVFLTPDLKPFVGGTYFPPRDMYGRPSFKRVLQRIIDLWQTQRQDVHTHATQLTEHMQGIGDLPPGSAPLDLSILRKAVAELSSRFDPLNGGFGRPPKFLHTMDLRLLLRAWKRFEDVEALHMVRHTLDRMAMGGLYDHLGGGFARYSTDAQWLVPHFEKMLYDNALLVVVYLETYQVTRNPFYREIAEETLGWVQREMTSPEGPFYSALDADSEGEEGKFYVWTEAEIESILGPQGSRLLSDVYNVLPEGNWEGHNILHRTKTFEQYARLTGLDEMALKQTLREARHKLFEVRRQRVAPGRDDKMLTAWNGLMIGAFALAAQVLDQPAYAETAVRAADFILTRMRTPEGRLLRTCSSGSAARLNGYLEDYAFLLDGLVSLYEATFTPRWLEAALDLAQVLIEQFWDPREAGFFFTGNNHEPLIARTKDPHDNATPSGNAMAVTALLRLVKLTGRVDLQEKAEATLDLYRGLLSTHPLVASQMALALDFQLGPVQEFAVVGEPAEEETRRVLRAIRRDYNPHKVVALQAPSQPPVGDWLPLLRGKGSTGVVTTYLCSNFTCQAPLTGAEAVEKALRETPGVTSS